VTYAIAVIEPDNIMKKILLYIAIIFFLGFASQASAHQPRIILNQQGDIQVANPEISQAFYDELKGSPRNYFIDSSKDWELYINLLVPDPINRDGRYSANIYKGDELIANVDGLSFTWESFYEEFGRDYYLKGPEFTQQVPAGKYRIEIYSDATKPSDEPGVEENLGSNQGKYVLAVGKIESFDIPTTLNVYWQLPLLKLTFFKTSVLQFFLTPFGIWGITALGVLLILWAIIYYLIGVIKAYIKHNQAKTLLLASSFPEMTDEIINLLQKPAYDVEVAFINTASKPEEDLAYIQRDLDVMKELGFNVEQVDIEGKKEQELLRILELKDIVFVEGGNTSYLLQAMRACNFEKVIRKLLKQGIVYIGVSAGSKVAGRMGLNLVPFDIVVHYKPENAEIIKQQMPNAKKRAKKLKIITDDQGILVQGKEVDLIGEGEAVVI